MGKAFDVVLSICILLSVAIVMMGSVDAFQKQFSNALSVLEWAFTALFTLEYGLRLISVRRPWLYFKSFFGLVDLLSILPTYLALLIPGTQYMLVIRILRLLRIFRILKLSEYMQEAQMLMSALGNSSRKIMVFLYAELTIVVIFGSLMYAVESNESRIYQYSNIDLLGHRYRYHGRLWRHSTANGIRPDACRHSYDYGLRHYCCADGYLVPSFIKLIAPEKSEMMPARIAEKQVTILMPIIANIAVINWMTQYSVTLIRLKLIDKE